MVSETTTGFVPTSRGDEALVAAALEDRAQFAALYQRYRLPVYRYLRARGADDDLALELTAVTFEKALVSLHRFRPRGGGFGAWLFRIARNARIDDHRRNVRLTEIDPTMASPHEGADPDLAIDLRASVSRLPSATRDATALRYAAGLTAAEIGVVLGKRPDAVQKLIERGLESLRETLL